ncbi:MAG: ParB N-terminal domain-containing protein [Anaerolineae bacterium]|nr:ParB N-terminal domain-containing protein [Anaerolineae bacterium]
MSGKRDNTAKLDALLASVTDDMLGGDVMEQFQDYGLRVERILLELVRPDPVQPRRVLPERLHVAFHNNRLTPTQALRELVQAAQIAARQRGRPFNGLLDLLPSGDGETDDEAKMATSPEETLLRDLVTLAVTIRDDGQVNPLTVVDITEGVTQLYRIETGERRYWASWLLRDFIPGYTGDGMIPCIVIPAQQASPFRQAKENTARSGLTAVAMARQAALLMLTVHGYEIPSDVVSNEFYRQALDLSLQSKQEFSAQVLIAMGGISRMHFSRYKTLLKLSDEAMEIADRYNIEEGKLRYIITLAPEYHLELVRQVVDLNLTSKQIKEICETGEIQQENDSQGKETIPRPALQMAKAARNSAATSGQDFARALLQQDRNVHLARAHIETLRRILDDAEQHLRDQ